MKTYTITVTGKTEGDIEAAIDEAKKRIMGGTRFGFDSNEDGSFEYKSDGEYEYEEEHEEIAGPEKVAIENAGTTPEEYRVYDELRKAVCKRAFKSFDAAADWATKQGYEIVESFATHRNAKP